MSPNHRDADHLGDHCPFLNRADERCSDYFHLDRLGHAFSHCFAQYRTCPVYAEQLSERRAMRARGRGAAPDETRHDNRAEVTLVQVTVSAGFRGLAAVGH